MVVTKKCKNSISRIEWSDVTYGMAVHVRNNQQVFELTSIRWRQCRMPRSRAGRRSNNILTEDFSPRFPHCSRPFLQPLSSHSVRAIYSFTPFEKYLACASCPRVSILVKWAVRFRKSLINAPDEESRRTFIRHLNIELFEIQNNCFGGKLHMQRFIYKCANLRWSNVQSPLVSNVSHIAAIFCLFQVALRSRRSFRNRPRHSFRSWGRCSKYINLCLGHASCHYLKQSYFGNHFAEKKFRESMHLSV